MSSSRSSEADAAIPPVVLVVGVEGTLRDPAVAEIRSRVLADATPEFNEDRFDLASRATDPGQIIAAARTLPVLARRRLVIVRGVSDRRAARFHEGELLAYLAHHTHQNGVGKRDCASGSRRSARHRHLLVVVLGFYQSA